ncbi:MAG: hypothetical protein JXR88_00875 [Clostridia bacterium]|nr:hypothetical protein [Clostridia bacterium]
MKKLLLIIMILIFMIGFSAFSEETIVQLLIDQIQVETTEPILSIDGEIIVPMIDTFKTLGAQITNGNVITSYYLNTFIKIDINNNLYSMNGKNYNFDSGKYLRNGVLYVPLSLLQKAFDLTYDSKVDNSIYLKANRVIQYRNYDFISYKQISFEEEGAKFSVPLDWDQLGTYVYGFDSSYGRISVAFSTRKLNENIDINYIVNTYQEHLVMSYGDAVLVAERKQEIYNYLTSNVLYIQLNVNDIASKRVVHFVESKNQVYIIEFNYPKAISETYLKMVIKNIMDSFYINDVSIDENSEHYMESDMARKYEMVLSSEIYSNMVVEEKFILEGYFKSVDPVDSLTVKVTRKDSVVEFYIPVEDNSFHTEIYTPFGLGKHNVKISITNYDEKIVFDPITKQPVSNSKDKNLLWFSVVNISDEDIRYTIPTKMIQSEDKLIVSMSNLVSYKSHTLYAKAKALYTFVKDEIEVLSVNDTNYSALDVYETFQGTKKEVMYYLTALLRSQDIPAKIIEGSDEFNQHYWVEAYLNGEWFILDPIGDVIRGEVFSESDTIIIPEKFNADAFLYDLYYPNQVILDH